ncbi:MAG: 3-oxoacyl-ACP reductase FabG [Natronospirillum sp.]|uniref:3-oxoacyl-ACP reductase FabG n=1 Tax=Natronospirillum sp. TaxID=2812955 RepID=UPI0025E3D288|nr:3-oxoacyl-ACP reductase FabG [Natronospirillum sp.]MCH8551021.1 3-oxoacyl-ACP reductase FabG [Natronospirillum sp.]
MTETKKVALVTGASRGIGKAIALQLAERGFVVAGTATSDGGAERISAYLQDAGVSGKGYNMNVTDGDSISAALGQIKADLGDPLVIVNNAGITKDNLFLRMKEEEWDAVINTNLSSAFRVVKACIKGMTKARWGRIINVSSVIGSMGNAGQVNYGASKAGLEGFTRSLAREVASRNITVNAVAPGFIQTDMTDELSEEHRDKILGQVPLGRLGQAEEVAKAIAFLASDDASYVTGETLHVNGGMYM